MSTEAVVIVGPTAVGKTRLGILVAERLSTEIISADAMQVYCGLSIGTAAPTVEERAWVVHHLVGTVDLEDHYSAAWFARDARAIIERLQREGRVPVVVGGSGLYLRALADGLFPGPSADQDVRERLRREADERGTAALHARLAELDPAAAEHIGWNDLRRIVRALEIFELTGRAISQMQRTHRERARDKLPARWFGLTMDREALYSRIDARVRRMFVEGFVEEVWGLMREGHSADIDRIGALGYREVKRYLDGEFDLDTAKELVARNTRRYAKRQMTWFRRNTRIQWFTLTDPTDLDPIANKIVDQVRGS